ncbi:hypothetical protein AAMO2058_000944200 [Amorphochlora amoebiformis]
MSTEIRTNHHILSAQLNAPGRERSMFLSSNWKKQLKERKKEPKKRKKVPENRNYLSVGGGEGIAVTAGKTAIIAMDCEMVGVGLGGERSALARCSIVNFRGEVLYDKFIQTLEKVTDYRTEVSGIRPGDLNSPKAIPFRQCQQEVSKLLERRVLVGHSVDNDLKCLMLDHPKNLLRDTAYHKPLCPKRPKALKKLVKIHLGKTIQSGEHSSVEDARCTLELYKSVMDTWEKQEINKRHLGGTGMFTKKRKRQHSDAKGAGSGTPAGQAKSVDTGDLSTPKIKIGHSSSGKKVKKSKKKHKRKSKTNKKRA